MPRFSIRNPYFIIVCCLALAVLARLTLKEPRRLSPKVGAERLTGQAPQLSGWHVCRVLWRNATFRYLLLGASVMYFFSYGILQWQPAFFVRSYGLRAGELGTWLAVILGGGSLVGVYAGGQLASRYAARNERLQLAVMAMLYVLLSVLSVLIYISPNRYLAFGLVAVVAAGQASIYGPFFAVIQTMVPEHMRATAVALLNLFANLIGMGLGPLAAGGLSDEFRAWAGDDSLRYALMALSPGYACVSWYLWQASNTVNRDLAAVAASDASAVSARKPLGWEAES